MLLLTSTSDIVRIITGSAAALDAHASFIDNASGTITPGRTNTASITTATTTTVVGSPGSSVQRNVKMLAIANTHATVSTTVIVEHFDGTTAETLWDGTLLAGENVILDEIGSWTHYDATGNPYATGVPLSTKGDLLVFDTAVNRLPIGADMLVLTASASATQGMKWASPMLNNRSTSTVSAGYAADTYLAGSSITMPAGGPIVGTTYHCMFDMVKTGAGTATAILSLRYGTAGTTADTALITFTFTAGTAVADTGTIEVWAHFRTVGSGTSAVIVGKAEIRHALAATGLTTLGASGQGQITTVSSGFNSTPAGSILGLSFNGGTSFSGTNTIVEAQAYNLSI
jgi:hypothetical protein